MEKFNSFLSQEECEVLIKYSEGINKFYTHKNHNRDLKVLYNNDYTKLKFLNDKLKSIGIINSPSFLVNRYSEGHYFLPHTDRGGPNDEYQKRVKTVIINLSDGKKYKGGALYVNNELMSNTQGSAVIFDATVVHELKLLEKGTRYSIVIWLKPQNIENFKSII